MRAARQFEALSTDISSYVSFEYILGRERGRRWSYKLSIPMFSFHESMLIVASRVLVDYPSWP